MAIRSALAAQLMYSEETTYGTYVAPTRTLEFVDESMQASIDRIESKAIRPSQRVQRSGRWKPNLKGAGGSVEHEVTSKGFGLILKHMLGNLVIATPGGGTLSRTHTATLADPYGLSLTMQVGRPDVSGVVQPFSYLGCVITEWEFSCEVDGILTLKLTFDAQSETTAQSLTVAAPAASDELLTYVGGTLNVAGSMVPVRKWSIKGSNGYKTDRYFVNASTLKKAPVAANMVEITGDFECEFDGLTTYNRFVNGAEATFNVLTQGSLIETTIYNGLNITLGSIRFDGDTPNISSGDVTTLPMKFKAMDDGTNQPITAVYTTTDTTA